VTRAAARASRAGRTGARVDAASVVVLAAIALAWLVVAVLRGVPAWAGWLYAGASALAFVLYAVDKSAAVAGRDRISESMLIAIGVVGGWPGAIVAQQVWRHKTVKWSFRLRFWASVAVNVAAFAWATTLMVRGAR
jgi:uncharacterized membrane protein YsdA (DUF1294 family)